MKRLCCLTISLLFVLSQFVSGDTVMKDLGLGQEIPGLAGVAYSESEDVFVVGSTINGYLFEFKLSADHSSLYRLNSHKIADDFNKAVIWDLCSDEAGIIYGGTCNEETRVFKYNPSNDITNVIEWTSHPDLKNETYIWSATASGDYVYYGTYPHALLIKCYKAGSHFEISDVFSCFAVGDSCKYLRCLATGPGGKIYGGTECGKALEYNPANDSSQIMDIGSGFLYYLEANNTYVCGGVTGDTANIGTILIDFPAHSIQHLYGPGNSILPGSYMTLLGDNLYTSRMGCKFDLSTNPPTLVESGTGIYGRYCSFNTNDTDYIGVFYQNSGDSVWSFKGYNTDSGSVEIVIDPINPYPHLNAASDIGCDINAIAADDVNVYGATFLKHSIADDSSGADDTVEMLAPCACANADEMITYGNYTYLGCYPQLSLGIYSPDYEYGVHIDNTDSLYEPSDYSNPLQRNLKIQTNGADITDEFLVRVRCFSVDDEEHAIYIGTGSSTDGTSGDNPYIIKFYTAGALNPGQIDHIKQVPGVDEIYDLEFYKDASEVKYLVMISRWPSRSFVYNLNSGTLIFNEEYVLNSLFLDHSTNLLYTSKHDTLSIYNVDDIISSGFLTATPIMAINLGRSINDIIKGNDGYIYIASGDRLGVMNNAHNYVDCGKLPVPSTATSEYQDKALSLTVSTDTTNTNVYIGANRGHMFVYFADQFEPFVNEDVIAAFNSLAYISDNGHFLGGGIATNIVYGSDWPEEKQYITHMVSGDFDGDNDDDVIAVFNNEFIYLSDNGFYLDGGGSTKRVYSGNQSVVNMASGDFDGDGIDEVLTAFSVGVIYKSPDGYKLGGGGNTQIAYITEDLNNLQMTKGFAIGDFDGDGDDDVITAFDNLCYLSDNGLNLGSSPIAYNGQQYVHKFAVGDFDGDGDDEVLTAFSEKIIYKSEDGFNLGSSPIAYNSSSLQEVRAFAVGDFDGDGDDEVITAFDNTCYLSEDGMNLGGGIGEGNTQVVYIGQRYVVKMVVGDFDGDGDDEVLTAFDDEKCYLSEDGTSLYGGTSIEVYGGSQSVRALAAGLFKIVDEPNSSSLPKPTAFPYSVDFEAITSTADDIGDCWMFKSSSAHGRFQREYESPSGNRCLSVDTEEHTENSTNQSWLFINLNEQAKVTLGFNYKCEYTPANYPYEEEIYFSDNSADSLYLAYTIEPSNSWQHVQLDVVGLADDLGISLNSSFVICFKQTYDYTSLAKNLTTNSTNKFYLDNVTVDTTTILYDYLPGDASMYAGAWPPNILGADVTYLVNYFRGTTEACLLGGFYASGDINGDCAVIGSDVTYLTTYFRGGNPPTYCPNYYPSWPTSGDLPASAPYSWPNCENSVLLNSYPIIKDDLKDDLSEKNKIKMIIPQKRK